MKVIKRKLPFERGQSIVIFTVSLAVLLMLMSLVLDGGLLLVRRREAQASADSGALAGVVQVCGTFADSAEEAAAEAAAETIGETYATTYNQATAAVGNASAANNTLQVTATITQNPALAGLMGFGPIDVSAVATARCDPVGALNKLMPFVFACDPPEGVDASDSEDCVQKIWEEETPPDPATLDDAGPWLLIHDSNSIVEELECLDEPNSDATLPVGTGDPTYWYGAWDCDFDNDGINDIIDYANRGWISLVAGTNPGAAQLSDWIVNGFDGEIGTHTWVGGESGTAGSVFMSVDSLNEPPFPIVFIPVFNALCDASEGHEDDPQVACPGRYHTDPPDDVDDITLSINGAQKYYHIIAFAAFQITCVDVGGGPPCPYRTFIGDNIAPPPPNHFTPGKPITIEGYFTAIVDPDAGGGIGLDTGTYTIKLTQ